MGRPGFRRVLLAVADAYKNKRADLDARRGSLAEAVAQGGSVRGRARGI